jgi:hypothetical protein
VRDLMGERDDSEGFVLRAIGRWNEAARCSCIFAASLILPLSLSLNAFALRSSVTFDDDVTSFRSSPVVVDAKDAAEERLQRC